MDRDLPEDPLAADSYVVTRSRRIAAPRKAVRDLLVDFHQWPRWSPWEDVDPDMERVHTGSDRGIGARYAWSGDRRAGAGTMEIVGVDDDAVRIDLLFTRPFKTRNTLAFHLAMPDDATTEVTWTMTGRRTFMTRVMGLVRSMDDLVGPDFERGLEQLERAATAG